MHTEALRLTAVDLEAPVELALARGTAVAFTHRSPAKVDPAVNEDAVALLPFGAEAAALVVADGVGGHALGDRASATAVAALAKALASANPGEGDTSRSLRGAILDGFELANRAVMDLPGDAATTLLVVELSDGAARVFHAGDSQALVTGQRGRVKHWSTPHSPVGYAVEAGLLDEQAALVHEDRHLVSNALGGVDMHIQIGPAVCLGRYDTVLLSSDGLADNLELEEIVELIRRGPLRDGVAQLVARSRERMSGADASAPSKPDDLSVVAWRAG